MVIDFRLRPPFGAFLETGMYADTAGSDFYAHNIGMERSDSAKQASMPLLLREMADCGITMGVATGRMGHHKGSLRNDEIIRLVDEYPATFAGLAGLNAGDCQCAIKELHRVCVNGPLRGVVLEPGSLPQPRYANDARIYPVYEECQLHGIPVMLMVGGRAGPDRSYSDPNMISILARDFPGINFIVAHACWPFVQEILGIAFYQENIHLVPDLYFFNLPGQGDYIRAASGYLQDRFLFASAYPFVPLDCVHEFKKCFPEKVLDKLLYQNAAKLLRLDIEH